MSLPLLRRLHVHTFYILILAASLSIPGASFGQFGHFFNDAKMTPDDIDLASQAAETLYTKSGVAPGDQARWNNPKNGHNGVIDVLEVEAGPCVTIRHIASTVAHDDIRYYVRRCKQANEDWILSPK